MDCKTFRPLQSVLNSFDLAAARCAIYIDYEGNKHAPPTLLGWSDGRAYKAAIIEPRFETCTARSRAREPVAMDHAEAARRLIRQAVDEQRYIVSWSWHDPKLLCATVDRRYQELFRGRYVNAIRVARRWHWETFQCSPPQPGGARLSYFAWLFDIRIPQAYGDKVVASHLSSLRPRFVEGLSYGELGTEERKRWGAVVKHNKWDLHVMEDIVKRILAGKAPARGRTPAACSGLA